MFSNAVSYLLHQPGLILRPVMSLLATDRIEVDNAAACNSLYQLDLSNFNATILNASYYAVASEVKTLGTCLPTAHVQEQLCRIQLVVNTSDVSALSAELWLPFEWGGRFLALGNSELNGCIDYENLEYGSSLGFATVGTNNGHDGDSGISFLNNSEVLADFTSRSVHIGTLVGKELAAAYYKHGPHHSYFMGCSMGGRQGIYAALHHPTDFDGVLAGAPATNLNVLMGWLIMASKHVGAPHGESSESFISPELWDLIASETMAQCDKLDGLVDGIITEPDACDFRPEALLCEGSNVNHAMSRCLSLPQVEALRKIYAPLYGLGGEYLFPRFDPGSETGRFTKGLIFTGKKNYPAHDWMKYAIYSNPELDYNDIGLSDIAFASRADPGNISTYNGDLSAFRDRGGKIITYQGRADDIVPSGNAKELYNLIGRTLASSSESLDEFYRLFLIPGMEHCSGGRGAIRFGQSGKDALPHLENWQRAQTFMMLGGRMSEEEPTNVLLALADWVENGNAPDKIVGESDDGQLKRAHCRYPMKSHWDGAQWICLKE